MQIRANTGGAHVLTPATSSGTRGSAGLLTQPEVSHTINFCLETERINTGQRLLTSNSIPPGCKNLIQMRISGEPLSSPEKKPNMYNQLKPLATAACLIACLTTTQAQTAARSSSPAPPPSGFEDFLTEAKNPLSWLSWGADFRARNEYYHEIVNLMENDLHEQDVIRFRARIWTTITPFTNLTFNGRLSAEPREWIKPSFVGTYKNQSGMEWRYGIADILNVKWDNAFGQPLTITAGRQDILIGDYYDWWLVADGTPGDGSWAFFLDSVRATWQAEEIKTKFDVIGIYQSAQPDDLIDTIGDGSDYFITEQDERGLILYASNKSIEKTQLDGYFMYKHDNARQLFGDDAEIYTIGGKATGTPLDHWRYSVEGAYQFGQKSDMFFARRDIDAYGGKAKLSYMLKDRFNNIFSIGGEFLSGDDPNTEEDEMFDLLWGRWPRWSELYIYSYIVETGGRVAQINNIARFGPEWTISPSKHVTFNAAYNLLLAPQDTPTRALNPAAFSNDSNVRGHYVQTVLKYQLNKHVSAHLWGEGIWQGDFYQSSDFLTFLRAEILLTF
jgi:hypothetical protein